MRKLMPATIYAGGFSSEKVYHLVLANGQEFRHIGFTHYMYDGEKKHIEGNLPNRHPPLNGFVEVIIRGPDKIRPDTDVVVEPPQLTNVDHSGYIVVSKDKLQPIPEPETIPYDWKQCPACDSKNTVQRIGFHFDHLRRCNDCNTSWDPEEVFKEYKKQESFRQHMNTHGD